MKKSYRILSLEACDIFKHGQSKKGDGYKLPRKGSAAYFRMFKNKLDYSLDAIELESIYRGVCHGPFAFKDRYNNFYTLAVINVKFRYKYRTGEPDCVDTVTLREHLYKHGFNVNGVHYVRYKRSAGSSRDGKCLFIDERLEATMSKWGECGLSVSKDLASWEAYKALSISSIKGIVHIPVEGILFVPDQKIPFTDEVISVELKGDGLTAERQVKEIRNNIWDGESLLDESVFEAGYKKKHMLLLRNKFFKSCAFRTRLQKWIKDKKITLDQLKERGFYTVAKDISQIVMVTTESSLKYCKFVGGISQENIENWSKHVDSAFGVVKWDMRTRFFGGKMVRSSYQLLNTIGFSKEQAENLLKPCKDYLELIRNDIDFMRFHFSDVYTHEKEEEDGKRDVRDNNARRARVLFKLMNINNEFGETELYSDFRDDMVKNQKDNMLAGHLLLSGNNATLFGNGPELLKHIAGEKLESELKPGQIRCSLFPDGQRLLCARSPHITMGNLYIVENRLDGGIWDYFDLGDNIVCVNAIGENIQQRLNGCDYDSDAMLITDDKMLIETAQKDADKFKVPFCGIKSERKESPSLAVLDHNTSVNKIGDIVNLSQKLNSIIWDKLSRGEDDIGDIYSDVCKLAVLSGIEIDKAKRAYDSVNAGRELAHITKKYGGYGRPRFFGPIDAKSDSRYNGDDKDKEEEDGKGKEDREKKSKKERVYSDYNTTMQYIYDDASKVDFRFNKPKTVVPLSISDMLKTEADENAADLKAKNAILAICREYRKKIRGERSKFRTADDDERDAIYENIANLMAERDGKIVKLLTNVNILMLLIVDNERKLKRARTKSKRKSIATDWNLYGPLLDSKMFCGILNESKEKLAKVVPDPEGEYTLYGVNYSKTYE